MTDLKNFKSEDREIENKEKLRYKSDYIDITTENTMSIDYTVPKGETEYD